MPDTLASVAIVLRQGLIILQTMLTATMAGIEDTATSYTATSSVYMYTNSITTKNALKITCYSHENRRTHLPSKAAVGAWDVIRLKGYEIFWEKAARTRI